MPRRSDSTVKVFEFESFASYFTAYVEAQKKSRPTFSYRVICRDTGIKSPALLSWYASGKRVPTPDILEILNDYIGWKPDEYAYAQSLASYERAKTHQEKVGHLERMRAISPLKNLTILEQAAINVMMKWYIVTILEMTHLKDFKPEVDWIFERLGERVSKEQIEEAFEALIETGLFVREADGRLTRPSKSIRTKDNVPNFAMRGWHVEMMKLAQRAIYLQEPTERYYSGVTMTIDSSKMKEAQSMLAEFRERFVAVAQEEGGDETYHFGFQFFRLTEKKKPKTE